MSAGRSPSKSFISIGGHVDLNSLLKLAENNSSVCIVEGFTHEASSIKFDIYIDLLPKQSDGGSSCVRATVKSGKSSSDFDLINGSTDLVGFIVETIVANANAMRSS